MQQRELHQPDAFPRAGFRARRWMRFERDLRAWLLTSEGEFAVWRATQAIGDRADAPRDGDR
ncbi:hypothetical protein [Patulibacter defluvii]|uniref:hypothetical protein n=1 Tax=Patulibacter defluvii TaxID=3095358 RepID=UPI002A74D529|nr:hypothetical protein [Patulibacter sp. DM4]